MDKKEVRKLAAIMFTDIEGYTAFVQQDEASALKKVDTHRRFLEEYTKEFNGEVIAFYGDGSLSTYPSALDAVKCGIAMQKAYQGDHPIPVRIGIHVGDIVFRDETVYGDGVNISSRIQAAGVPGSVLISDRVQEELKNHRQITTISIGKKELKNVSKPIEVFAVTNEGLKIPSPMTKMPDLKKFYRYIPLLLLPVIAWWFIDRPFSGKIFGDSFTAESISVPVFSNNTGDPSLDFISQMGAHWITKELSSTNEANVVSYESASDMLQLSGLNLSTKRGRAQYESLTGAVNVVEASYARFGTKADSLIMSGWISNLQSGKVVQAIKDVKCSAENPMDCIQAMSGLVKGYWVSRHDNVLTPPNYQAYKAFMAAKGAWRDGDPEFVRGQLNKAILLDPSFIDPYFLMLDFFYNEGEHQAAYDTIQSIRNRFPELDARETNLLQYHTADVNGQNDEAYAFFLKEYAIDPKDFFTNNSAMVMAMMYRHNPKEALKYFRVIPTDSLQITGCSYCVGRIELAMWAALDADSMELADKLAVTMSHSLDNRKSNSTMIMYYVWKNDTTKINKLVADARTHPAYEADWEYFNYLACRLFLLRGQPDIASVYAQKAIIGYKAEGGRMLGKSYYYNNQLDQALSIQLAELKKKPDDVRVLIELGMIYARKGNEAEAKKIIAQLETRRRPFEYGSTEYHQGRIYAILGDLDAAVAHIATSITKGQKYDLWITFDHDPDLMVLRDYPGYIELMARFE